MRLLDLEPRFVRYYAQVMNDVPLIEAQGLLFLCPKCFAENNGPVGTHRISVTFEGRGATDEQGSHDKDGKPSRWGVTGTGFDDLTLHPSIHLTNKADEHAGCGWHGFVKNGAAT